jgi:rhodanese-related sulfurtransferase
MTITDMHAVATSLTAREVYTRLLHNQRLFILDVRNPDDYGRWRIEGQTRLETLNIPYYDFIEDEDATVARLPKNREILVICAKEGSSQYITPPSHTPACGGV